MAAMCGQLQNSITACVYFLTPHRLKKVDLIMMSALSQLVSCYCLLVILQIISEDNLRALPNSARPLASVSADSCDLALAATIYGKPL